MPRIVLLFTAIALLLGAHFSHASPSLDHSYNKVVRKSSLNVILSPSTLQSTTVVGIRVDHVVRRPARIWILPIDHGSVKHSILFVRVVSPSGERRLLRWHLEDSEFGGKWVVGDLGALVPGSILEVGHRTDIIERDGYFVGFDDGVRPSDGVTDFSGCFKVASGVPFSMQYNKGVVVTQTKDPEPGYKEWCYRYRALPGMPDHYLHYFAASTAKSWGNVAHWYRSMFAGVAEERSEKKEAIVSYLGLRKRNVDDKKKTQLVKLWMNSHLRYSGKNSRAHVPRSFDYVVRSGFGECKGLSLVMIELLRAAGISAHLVLTSTKSRWAFSWSSARYRYIDHVAVYLPESDEFIDPTASGGAGLVGHQAMDVETGKILTIH